jgi:hypothetical protein
MPMEIGTIRSFLSWLGKFSLFLLRDRKKSCFLEKFLTQNLFVSWPSCCSSPGAHPAPNGRGPAQLADQPCRPLMFMFPILARRSRPWHHQLRPGQCSCAGAGVDRESFGTISISIRWRCFAIAAAGKSSSICAAGQKLVVL